MNCHQPTPSPSAIRLRRCWRSWARALVLLVVAAGTPGAPEAWADCDDPVPFRVGQHTMEAAKVRFVASAQSMPIRVFDTSSVDKDVRCTVGSFGIEAE